MQLSWNIFGQASPSRYMHMNCQNWHNFAADDGDGFSGGGDPIEQGGPRLAARGHQGGLPDALQVDFCLALLKQPRGVCEFIQEMIWIMDKRCIGNPFQLPKSLFTQSARNSRTMFLKKT